MPDTNIVRLDIDIVQFRDGRFGLRKLIPTGFIFYDFDYTSKGRHIQKYSQWGTPDKNNIDRYRRASLVDVEHIFKEITEIEDDIQDMGCKI